jgi:molecular chaperone DnaK
MANFVGIDLGTTFSAVATLDETGRPIIVHNEDGQNITPSVVSFDGSRTIVGGEAQRSLGNDPDTAGRFKRKMGSEHTYHLGGADRTPTMLSALVLKKLKQFAEASIGPIAEAVVTIPANFANEAREATLEAAKEAGLKVNYIINEPTAAALFYASQSGSDLHGTYAVYDLGGGTFDVSIIKVNGQEVEVIATNGVSELGGDDFDEAIRAIVRRKCKEETGAEPDEQDYSKNDAEDLKKSLSKRDSISKRVSSSGGRANITVTRNEFEEAISSLIAQAEMLCETALDEANLTTADIDKVFLVGGSTRVPCVFDSVKRIFKQEPVSSANVDEVVALGACLYAAYKGDQSILNPIQRETVEKLDVKEITSKYYGTLSTSQNQARGIDEQVNAVLIEKGEKIPCSKTESFYTVHVGQQFVNCQVTESATRETNPQFVNIEWEGQLELPENRPADQEIRVTFSYDSNQTMKCSFLDVASGRKTSVDLSMDSSKQNKASRGADIEDFLVE